ncbi:MAG: hypothetical protein R3C05_21425 [Pirellulaceae bacterium]
MIDVHLEGNIAGDVAGRVDRGGGIAVWDGNLIVQRSRISNNQSDLGGGVFVCGQATASIDQSTIDNNDGGGLLSYSSVDGRIENSTVAMNVGLAIASRSRDFDGSTGSSFAPSISNDGSKVAFLSDSTNLVDGDTGGHVDAFVYDFASGRVERVSVSSSHQQANDSSHAPMISGDGDSVVFFRVRTT